GLAAVAAPAVVGKGGPVRDRVPQRPDRVAEVAAAGEVQEPQGHDPDVPADPGHAQAVVSQGADGAGDVGAVAVVVEDVAVVVDEIPAVHVVHVAVAVVVDAIAGDLAGVAPHVRRQVGVGVVHAGVDDGDHGVRVAGGDGPGAGAVDVGAGLAA